MQQAILDQILANYCPIDQVEEIYYFCSSAFDTSLSFLDPIVLPPLTLEARKRLMLLDIIDSIWDIV